MSIENSHQLMTTYVDALRARGAYDDHFSDDVKVSLMGYDRQVTGRTAARQFIDFFHDQAFTADIQIQSVVSGENRAHIEAVFAARHTGEFEGIAATGRQVNVPYSVGYDIANGKITALRLYFPLDVLVRQVQGDGAKG